MNTKTSKNFALNRREGRIIAFQAIFSYDFNNSTYKELIKFNWLDKNYSKESLDYARYLIKGTLDNLKTIDDKIKLKLRNWNFERISNVDKAILRFSIFSMLFEDDLPEKVAINEAIEIVKNFGSKESYKFVNGILDALKRSKKPN